MIAFEHRTGQIIELLAAALAGLVLAITIAITVAPFVIWGEAQYGQVTPAGQRKSRMTS